MTMSSVQCTQWPPQLPHLNPTGHLWDVVKEQSSQSILRRSFLAMQPQLLSPLCFRIALRPQSYSYGWESKGTEKFGFLLMILNGAINNLLITSEEEIFGKKKCSSYFLPSEFRCQMMRSFWISK